MLLGAALCLCTASAPAADWQTLRGQVPSAVAHLTPTGDLPDSNQLRLAIGLPLTNPEALASLLHQIYDPASPLFGHYLTPQEFTERFGPARQDYEAVVSWAKAKGLTVSARHPNRVVLDVSGSVADVQKALNVKMRTYRHPKEARTFYAPSAEPLLDLTVPVLRICGLDNYALPFPKLHRASENTLTNVVPQNGSGPGGNYMGYDFRNAYVPGTILTGSGQSVGLLEFDGYYPNDVAQYLAQAGLPSVPLVNVYVDGFNGVPGFGNGEVTLDIDMSIAMAPGLTQVIVYMAPNNIGLWVDILSRMANDNLAKQLSCSWGGGPPDPACEQIFLQMAAQGQSFFDAIGDSDAFPATNSIPFPGESTNITQVGGTTLSTSGPLGSWVSEKVWNWGNGIGTCGGISVTYPIPVWQLGINMTTNQGSTTMRNLPDVALTADNIYIIADNGIEEPGTGGTSCAAPLWAGFTALVNQQAAQGARAPVGFLNPTIYNIGKSPLYGATFHDIVVGNNTSPASTNEFYAVPGYDLCTGWGTPAGTNLIDILAPPAPMAFVVPVGSLVYGGNGNGVVDVNECNDLNVTLANFGGGVATTVRATLSTTTPGVFIAQPSAVYPNLPPGGYGTNLAPFTISTSPSFVCGTPIDITVLAKCDQSSTTNLIVLPSGEVGTNVLRFDNSTPAFIPDLGETNSIVLVSNITAALSKVTVSLFITHTYDSDLLLQLISPDGTTNTLSASNGGSGQNYGLSCSPDAMRTTFDDGASNSISGAFAPFVGTFQPETPLAVFIGKSGTNINGAWRLRAVDQALFDVGTLQCWSLFLTPAACLDGGGECPGADMAISLTAQPEPAIVGGTLTYNISVTNNGPSNVKDAQVTHLLPNGVVFESAVSSQGACAQSGGVVTCNLGAMAPGGWATITVQVMPLNTGTVSSTALVSSEQPDPNPSNNSATFVSHINPPSADLAVGLAATPNPAVVGNTITYTVSVTNNGPLTGSGIVVTNVLPASLGILSASVSQGSITSDGSVWTVGNVAVGGWAIAHITIVPSAVGTFTVTSSVAGNQSDPIPANNVATVSTIVGPSADVSVAISEYPNPAVVLSNVTYVFSVSNAGPSTATSIALSGSLPASVNVITANTSQGSASISGTALTWSVGNLNSGAQATLTIVAQTTTNDTLVVSATVAASEPDPNPANNSATSTVTVAPAGVAIVAAGATLTAESFYPPNGAIDAGETVTVILRLRNSSNSTTLNLVGTLLATNGVAPVAPNNPQTYGVLAPSGFPVGRSFSFTANGTNGQTISAILQLHDGATVYPPVSFPFTLSSAQSFASTNTILIPDPAAPNPPYPVQSGPGKPYPSTITVGGLVGVLGKVTVTVSNLTHSFPGDINLLLASPNGASALLMSHAGDEPSTNVNLTFDDSAASLLPSDVPPFDGPLYSGVWQPSVYSPGVQLGGFPAPAPPGPYQTALSAFNAGPANGTWSLYAFDDGGGDAGAISNGWSLTLSMITPVNQLADLGLSAAGVPNPVLAGTPLTYTFTVANGGPSTASSIAFTNIVPAGLTLVSATPSQGVALTNGNTVLANLGILTTGAVATVAIVAVPSPSLLPSGINSILLTNTATVWPAETDPSPANNTASAVITVTRPVTGLEISQSGAPEPVFAGNALTNTIVVTNVGPATALAVVLTDPLPAGTTLGSATTTVGTCSSAGGVVTCSFGNLASNTSATVTLVLTNSLVGFMTNTASVTTGSQNTNSANNTATYVATVLGPAAKVISAGAVLTHESGPVNGLIDPGETVTLSFALANVGSLDTYNLKATLLASGEVTSPSSPRYYGALVHNGPSIVQSFSFTAAAVLNSPIVASLQLQDERPGVTNSLGTVTFTFGLPSSSAWSNGNTILIPDHGAATPYPSSITVSGVIGSAIKATVTLNGFTHQFPHDVSALLVGPSGANVLLMSHTGGGHSVSNLTLTFDDAAAGTLPNSNPDLSGIYRPSTYPGAVTFPFPAPIGPFGSTLAGVAGWSPNGTWSLFVLDDTVGDSGYITSGWSLNLTTAAPLVPLADLAIGLSSTPSSLYLGSAMTNSIWVTNRGPATATGVMVTNTLSSGQQVIANVGSVAAGATAAISIVVAPSAAGTLTTTVSVGGNEVDLNPSNNSAQTTTAVTVPALAIMSGVMMNGQMHLTLTAQAGFVYAIQESTNLTAWLSLTTNTVSSAGTIRYTDTSSPSFRQRFYRGLRLSP